MAESERETYRARARELLEPHSRDELKRRVQERLLPLLLP